MKITTFRALALASAVFAIFHALPANAAVVHESFITSPAANGWLATGDTNLFVWDSTNQNLRVTWDSTRPNSYLYLPLEAGLTRADAFAFSFDLRLESVTIGTFEIAAGFLNLSNALSAGFIRGTGADSPNLAEFNYFPDYTSVDATIADANSVFQFAYDFSQAMYVGTNYTVTIRHAAGDSMLSGEVRQGATLVTTLPFSFAQTNFTDFYLNAFAVSSYDGTNSFSDLLATGVIDNISLTLPDPIATVTGGFSNSLWRVEFNSRSNWNYTLERTTDLRSWSAISPMLAGSGGPLALQETNAAGMNAFYRVQAARP